MNESMKGLMASGASAGNLRYDTLFSPQIRMVVKRTQSRIRLTGSNSPQRRNSMRLIDADALLSDIERTIEESGCVNHESEIMDCVRYAPTVDAAPVVRGEWNYTIKKGSCMDYSVTAKCSKCGWDWFSKDGVGNYSAVFGAFITNGDSKPEEAERFLLKNARANNKLNYCPNCGAKMEVEP